MVCKWIGLQSSKAEVVMVNHMDNRQSISHSILKDKGRSFHVEFGTQIQERCLWDSTGI